MEGAAYCVALCLSVCLSVRLSVRPVTVAIATSVTCFRQPCGRAVSFVLFTCQGRISYGDLSRTSLLYLRRDSSDAWTKFQYPNSQLTTPHLRYHVGLRLDGLVRRCYKSGNILGPPWASKCIKTNQLYRIQNAFV